MKYGTCRSGILALALLALLACGCKKAQTQQDLIRQAINEHLAGVNTLNLNAMDMDITSVSIQGTQATAQVTFRPKTGAPPGAGMQVAYQLEKGDSAWVVVKTDAAGGAIQHPAPDANSHLQPGQSDVHGDLPNFRDILPSPSQSSSGGTLPPGHPPIPPNTQSKPQDSSGKPN